MIATILQRLTAATIETAVAACIVFGIAALLTRRSPRLAAFLWLTVLLKPLLTLAGLSVVPVPLPALVASSGAGTAVVELTETRLGGTAPVTTRRTSEPARPFPLIPAIWLAGAAVVLGRTVRDRLRLRTIIRGSRPAAPHVAECYGAMTAHLLRAPRLRISDILDGPAIAGFFRPVILLPSGMETRADAPQIAWTLRHELRHATARDLFGIAVREAALVTLWFHPAVWMAAKRWEVATELACDRDVVASDAEALDYAEALCRILGNVRHVQRVRLATGLFATRSKIGTRIAALVDEPWRRPHGKALLTLAALAGTAVLMLGVVPAGRTAHHRGNIEEIDGSVTVKMDWDGNFDVPAIAPHIDSVSDGGWADFRETAGGTTRELRIEGTSAGTRRTWSIDGRPAALDRDAAAFEQRMTERMVAAMYRRAVRHVPVPRRPPIR